MSIRINSLHLERLVPFIFLIIFLSANFFNTILVLRSALILSDLEILKRMFLLLSRFLLPVINVLYFFMTVILVKYWTKGSLFKIFLVLVGIESLIVISLSLYLNYLEAANYSNFVFSQFHIYLPSLRSYADFQMLLLFVAVTSFLYYQFPMNRYLKILEGGIPKIALLIVLSIIIYDNLLDLPKLIYDEITLYKEYVFAHPNKRAEIPDLSSYYFRIRFIRDNTEENSVIIHPPQSVAFPEIGNQPLIRYILFPRKLVSRALEDKFFSENKDYGGRIYYMLAKGRDQDEDIYFPDHSMEAEEIRILLKDGEVKNYYNVRYSLEFAKNLGNFEIGVIRSK